jgi:hypothetical protein
MKTKITQWSTRRRTGFQREEGGQRWYTALAMKRALSPIP